MVDPPDRRQPVKSFLAGFAAGAFTLSLFFVFFVMED
jgi:hypothetical protein